MMVLSNMNNDDIGNLAEPVYIRVFNSQNEEIDLFLRKDKGYRWENKSHFFRCALVKYLDFLKKGGKE
jgi:hypothetical protein